MESNIQLEVNDIYVLIRSGTEMYWDFKITVFYYYYTKIKIFLWYHGVGVGAAHCRSISGSLLHAANTCIFDSRETACKFGSGPAMEMSTKGTEVSPNVMFKGTFAVWFEHHLNWSFSSRNASSHTRLIFDPDDYLNNCDFGFI